MWPLLLVPRVEVNDTVLGNPIHDLKNIRISLRGNSLRGKFGGGFGWGLREAYLRTVNPLWSSPLTLSLLHPVPTPCALMSCVCAYVTHKHSPQTACMLGVMFVAVFVPEGEYIN